MNRPGDGVDGAAADRLMPLVYEELRSLARRALVGESPGHTLQPTALVNEAYLRLAGSTLAGFTEEGFKVLAARAMRRVLVDHARKRRSAKRGNDAWQRVTLHEALTPSGRCEFDLVALNDILEKLCERDPRMGQIVELRFFGGLSIDEIANALGVSDRTVDRDWLVAKAWLARSLESGAAR